MIINEELEKILIIHQEIMTCYKQILIVKQDKLIIN